MQKYARLIAQKGANVQKNQEVFIDAGLDQPEFVKMLVEECYRKGAKKVTVEWDYQPLTKVNYRYRSLKTLSTMDKWQIEKYQHKVDVLPAMIYLESDDPDGLKGVDQQKVAKAQQALYPIIKPMREKMENKYQWCIAAVPGEAWAKKVFPGERVGKAVEKLWEAILFTSRAADGNGVANWERHNAELKKRCAYLNSLGLKELHYRSSNGTDLRVGLIPGVLFQAGGEKIRGGDFEFQPNIPSEECFTSPMKGKAEGVVYSAKPLVYNGQVISDFYIVFKEGKAVEVHAKEGEEALRSILSLDEGSAYLGECALVPYDSPINNTGLLFYNTLYDENACCHLALGRGFNELYPGYENLSEAEIREKGINFSMSHVDFMIGSKDLSIVGTKESGEEVPLFENGNWAFEF